MVLIEMIWIVRINDFENILLCLVLILFWKWELVTCFWSKQVSMESVVFCFEKNVLGFDVKRKDLRSFEEKWHSWIQNDLVWAFDQFEKLEMV